MSVTQIRAYQRSSNFFYDFHKLSSVNFLFLSNRSFGIVETSWAGESTRSKHLLKNLFNFGTVEIFVLWVVFKNFESSML